MSCFATPQQVLQSAITDQYRTDVASLTCAVSNFIGAINAVCSGSGARGPGSIVNHSLPV